MVAFQEETVQSGREWEILLERHSKGLNIPVDSSSEQVAYLFKKMIIN